MFDHLPETFRNLIPFVLATGQTQKLSAQRIVEAVIIAFIAGSVSVYGVTQALQARLENVEKRIEERYSQDRRIEEKLETLVAVTASGKVVDDGLSKRLDKVENKVFRTEQ